MHKNAEAGVEPKIKVPTNSRGNGCGQINKWQLRHETTKILSWAKVFETDAMVGD